MEAATVRGADPDDAQSKVIERLRINQLQFIGTHNSYHVREAARASRNFPEWNYTHAPLDMQLDRGVRSFELDLHRRAGVFEVFHVAKLDEGTTCRRLVGALQTVRKWSDAHPRHVPISFLFEIKRAGDALDSQIQGVDAAGLDRLDTLLGSVFPAGHRIAPDDVRAGAATLRDGIRSSGWPTLADSRGKVFFILHDEGRMRDLYTQGHASLRGRVMFVRSDETREDGAILILDNPRNRDIPRLVRAGFFVRTRADADLKAHATSEPARRNAAFASGAHILSTDFPAGEAIPTTGYVVEFAHRAPARINPVNGPESLRGRELAADVPSSRTRSR
jgi:hypothetical protein